MPRKGSRAATPCDIAAVRGTTASMQAGMLRSILWRIARSSPRAARGFQERADFAPRPFFVPGEQNELMPQSGRDPPG
jgi:hypothetical protein